ncbi:MAG: tetrahydrofolate synthase, partial [Acidimicrobiia bacterium]
MRRAIRRHPEVVASSDDVRRAAIEEPRHQSGIGLPQHQGRPGLDDAGLVGRDLLGSPQETYPEIHLTGTNGKTSAARMTSALLEASGLSVGTYTSPH